MSESGIETNVRRALAAGVLLLAVGLQADRANADSESDIPMTQITCHFGTCRFRAWLARS